MRRGVGKFLFVRILLGHLLWYFWFMGCSCGFEADSTKVNVLGSSLALISWIRNMSIETGTVR